MEGAAFRQGRLKYCGISLNHLWPGQRASLAVRGRDSPTVINGSQSPDGMGADAASRDLPVGEFYVLFSDLF
jgi:hypothetical protein